MKIFCSGIGGIGLSAYAAYMSANGHDVRGSDRALSIVTEDLTSQGIEISENQDGSAIPEDIDLFVYSEAIPESSPERMKAKELSIRQISYFQAVGEISKDKDVICIAGSHGKSTTTAMIAKMMIDAGKDPNVILGTRLKELGNRNWRKGDSDLWIIEACEYRKSFLNLSPKTIVLTTLDVDHFDAYPTQEAYTKAYEEFLSSLPSDGIVIGHGDDSAVDALQKTSGKTFVNADTEKKLQLSVPGEHMRQNAQLALALARVKGIDLDAASKSLQGFSGTWRRMERRGELRGALVFDDYAHHPVEISATIQAAKEQHPEKRIVCVFQPHMHNRTLKLWDEFSACFHGADLLLLSDVYDARADTETELVDMEKLASAIREKSQAEVILAGDLQGTEVLAREHARPDDNIIVMGAGTITDVASALSTDCC